MIGWKPLELKRGQRGAIIGRTGTGKTHLAMFLIPTTGKLCVIDPKRTYEDSTLPVYKSPTWLWIFRPKRFIYRPSEGDLDNIAAYNEVFRYCYEQFRPGFIYIDDMIGIMNKYTYPHYLKVCYMMGRALGVTCLACFQRPVEIPGFLYSEANKLYVFHLHHPADVLKVRSMMPGYNPDRLTNEHAFFYYEYHGRKPRKLIMPAQLPANRSMTVIR